MTMVMKLEGGAKEREAAAPSFGRESRTSELHASHHHQAKPTCRTSAFKSSRQTEFKLFSENKIRKRQHAVCAVWYHMRWPDLEIVRLLHSLLSSPLLSKTSTSGHEQLSGTQTHRQGRCRPDSRPPSSSSPTTKLTRITHKRSITFPASSSSSEATTMATLISDVPVAGQSAEASATAAAASSMPSFDISRKLPFDLQTGVER